MASNGKAVTDAPVPTNVTELRAFLGKVNYYLTFLDRLSTVMEPLHNLLRKEVEVELDEELQRSIHEAEENVV